MRTRSPIPVSLPKDEAIFSLKRASPSYHAALVRARSRFVPQTKMIKVELDFDPAIILREMKL